MSAGERDAADDAAELVRARAENAALDEQVKLLVQTEQRLYRTQNAREHELRRIRAIGAFALEVVSADRAAILARALAVLHECFALDAAVVVESTDGDAVRVLGAAGKRAHALGPTAAAGLAAIGEPATTLLDDGDGELPLRALLGELDLGGSGWCCTFRLDEATVAVAISTVRKRPVYREDPLGAQHLPLVQLIAAHVRRVLEHAVLTEDLKLRSARLAEVNAQLAASVRTLERTQNELIAAGKMEAIGRLAGGVAHDFNNLLTVILNHASLATDDLPPGARATHDLECVIDAGKRAAEITSQLLALGRRTVQKREHVDVGGIARELGRVLVALLGRRVTLHVESELECAVFADRSQLEQVILNLVINARDAMPEGGTVRVHVRGARADDLRERPGAPDPAGFIALEVADTGSGMDEETRLRIFEPFFTTKSVGHGTGLGLSVVYGVVTQSDGFISVDSRLGVGTRFIVVLPRSPHAAAIARPPPTPAPRGARVLVVEDSDAIRQVALRILRRAGYEVEVASDGLDALAVVAARSADFDLVVTDLNMPRMGGLELVHQLSRIMPASPVLFMTGYSDELAEVSARAPGATCMTKPFTPDQLLGQVSDQLVGRGMTPADRR